FAPGVDQDITFVAVELRWDPEGRSQPARPPFPAELLLSENEPEDPTAFFRWGKFRLRKYESYLDLSLTVAPGQDPAEAAGRRREQVRKKVAKEWDTIHAYFQYRWQSYRSEHPGRPLPTKFILHVRQYHIPEPGGASGALPVPASFPIARWRPRIPASSA